MKLVPTIKLRLHSELFTSKSIDAIKSEFEQIKTTFESDYKIKIVGNRITLGIGLLSREYWSPTLRMDLDAYEDQRTHIKIIVGPDPILWVLYIALYYIIGLFFLIFTAIVISKIYMGQSFKIDLMVLITLTLSALILYFFGKLNRKKGKLQLKELEELMQKGLEE